MAGDWIKFETTTLDKPEVFEIAADLGIDPDAVVGKCLRIWSWFDSHSRDGNAPVTVVALLNRVAGVTNFTAALEKVGWLLIDDTTVTLPKFDRHNGKSAKERALGKNRAKKSRSCNGESNGATVTKALPEKRREEKSIIEREQCAGEEPEPDLPEAEIPSLDEVVSYGGLVGCSEEMCRKFFDHYDGNNLWRNQHDKAIKWRIKLVGWRSREHEHKTKGSNFERQGTVSESVSIIRDTKALERAEARRKQIREKYDMHMDWSLEDRQEDRKLRETIEILKKQLGFAA